MLRLFLYTNDHFCSNCCSRTLMLKVLLMLRLFSLSVGVWRVWLSASMPPLFCTVVCRVVPQCVFSASLYWIWSPAVTSVSQPERHALHPSDTSPACLSSGLSSFVLEWHRMRDLDRVSESHKVSSKYSWHKYQHCKTVKHLSYAAIKAMWKNILFIRILKLLSLVVIRQNINTYSRLKLYHKDLHQSKEKVTHHFCQ